MKIKCIPCIPRKKNCYNLSDLDDEVYRCSPKMNVRYQDLNDSGVELRPVIVLREEQDALDEENLNEGEQVPPHESTTISTLPDGATKSQILTPAMIQHVIDVLPANAQGYPWVEVYNTDRHGFSLATLYRHMDEIADDSAPVLLLVRDVLGHTFGAFASSPLKPDPHYYGLGSSCMLFRFEGAYPDFGQLFCYHPTGLNDYFINATQESISFGASDGHSGLWLDQDLNNGRTQHCDTFNNDPLVDGKSEDFVIQSIETFSFSFS